MSFVTKDGFWIEGDDSSEFIVPHKDCSNFVLYDWCGMTQEEIQEIMNKVIEISADKISKWRTRHEDS